MPQNPLRVAIYADATSNASPSPLWHEMKRVLKEPAFKIDLVDQHDLRKPSFFGPDLAMFVLPGIAGETSAYPDHIGPEVNAKIHYFIQTGGTFMGYCAGAYYAAQTVRYTPEWAAHKGRDSGLLGLFGGAAWGPLPNLGVDGEDPRYYKGLTTARLALCPKFRSAAAQALPAELDVCYSSGPTFEGIPLRGRVLARYAAHAGQAPAIVSFPVGNGLCILSGVVPQYGYMSDPLPDPRLKDVMTAIAPHEAHRQLLFDTLMAGVVAHCQKTGQLSIKYTI